MAFDKPTRNRLSSFVAEARRLVAEEFTQQFQSLYGISDKGAITPLDQLGHLDDIGLATATLLRERIDYFIKTHPEDREGNKAAVARLAREQAFTVLNRFAAIRMAETRGIIVESVGKGYQSKGFKVFEQISGSGLGDTYHRYRRYIFCLFDELAVDLGVLFDRRSPQGLLFPREAALQNLFTLLNTSDLDPLWAEDETIGWIYQYYNDPVERKKMRDESAAPRNSRELAVRNQFFTPRYVVEFLTDNTLGRIWYEMTKGKTQLTEQCRYLVRRPTEIFLKPNETAPEISPQEDLSQEELLKQPVYIPYRPLKDPREIGLLDPACGSMHFGLYAFDLFEAIYEEAWEFGLEALRRAYPEKDAFLREIPRLIIEHNLHGIDIDPRATQIAGLSLWLRAQKSWHALHVPAAQRPRIMRSNIVCAEPMPGSPEMLREFTATLHPPLLGQMVEKVFAQMQLAGEAGSLLKIEEEIATLVKEAKKLWKARPKAEQLELSLGLEEKPKQLELPLAVSGISDERFWETAEERIYAALHAYAEQTESGGYQRRLFAEDAARGFAFIDLCRKRYDVVVMNPPFGEGLEITDALLEKHYTEVGRDLAATFVERGQSLLGAFGRSGCIATRGLLIGHRLTDFRDTHFFRSNHLRYVADLGSGVLDATVEVACIVLESAKRSLDCAFFDLVAENEKGERLLVLILDWSNAHISLQASSLNLDLLRKLPDRVVTGWIPSWLSRLFSEVQPLDPSQAIVVKGLITGDDFRFIRLFPEVETRRIGHDASWVFFAKGGEYSPYHFDIQTLLAWESSGKELKAFALMTYDSESRTIKNQGRFGLPGISYSMSSSIGFAARVQPSTTVLADIGPIILPRHGVHPLSLLAYLNSTICISLLKVWQGGRRGRYHWISESLQGVPAPTLDSLTASVPLVERIITVLRKASSFDEAGTHFVEAQLMGGGRLSEQFENLQSRAEISKLELSRITEEIDVQVASVLCVPRSSLQSIRKLLFTESESVSSVYRKRFPESSVEYVSQCVSYWFGCAFGRWDIRYVTGERAAPELRDPFAPLPVCPPGMLQSADGLPTEPKDVPANYPLRISWLGILVDDENHPEDIVARIREVLEVIWKDRADAIEHEACELLGVKTLRDYFRRPTGFFADHLKRYSKSRRQAPIYWPLSTAKGSYTLWIYYHRLTDQILHTVLADFVDPKLKAVRAEINALRESETHRSRLEELQDLEKELADFHTEIERIIKLPWKPNLNDGVLITASPLWKLFRLPKWQKDLKACWDKLEKGEYDWAHLAYSIWTKRVEEVCKKDRSIAIAHNLEHLCQVAPPKAKAKKGKGKKANAPEEGEQ